MNERKDIRTTQKDFYKLLQKMRKNPQEGMEEFYELYARKIKITAFCTLAKGRAVDRTDEVVNTVLLKVFEFAKNPEEIENPNGWISIVTRNSAVDVLKEKRFVPLNENMSAEKDPIDDFISEDAFYFLIKDLSETEQAIIIYKFVYELTFQQIADILHMPLPTVSSILYRAYEKIKKKKF